MAIQVRVFMGALLIAVCACCLFAQSTTAPASQPATKSLRAFPEAQGFGAFAPGGRGGRVLFVTSLADSGPGTLRAACEAEGPRIVVFRTGGIIELKRFIRIRNPYITIAGQTAPGDGICVRGWPVAVQTHDVIIRHMRFRSGDQQQGLKGSNSDALEMGMPNSEVYNVILDHCSFSWAIDENLSTWNPCRDITIQWCMISEALHRSTHEKGPHSMGLLIGDHSKRISVHHNLMAFNNYRNPQPKGDTSSEIVNNVVFHWGWSAIPFSDPEGTGPSQAHILSNVFMPGNEANPNGGCVHFSNGVSPDTRIYMRNNLAEGDWPLVTPKSDASRARMSDKPLFEPSGITIDPVEVAREQVLERAGATQPSRDPVDRRVVEQVRTRTGKIIDSQQQVGGWPTYQPGTAPRDSDNDGMPDEWETQHKLNPQQPDDAADTDGDGYTNIEEFLNRTDPRRS